MGMIVLASKKMKYASLAGVGLMSMSLVACANESDKPITLGDSMTQNGIQKIENSPVKDKCRGYELQKDGSYKCEPVDDSGGSGGGSSGSGVSSAMWFFNGMMFGSHNQMTSSSNYKANNLVSGTKTTSSKSTPDGNKSNNSKSNSSKSGTSSGKSSGFGSGGRGSSGGS